MKLGALRKQVAQEMRQNPKKAVVLGLMCLVALYYWVPIISRWTSPDDKSANVNPPLAAMPQLGATPAAATDAHVRWETIAEAIDSSPFSQPVAWEMERDPFGNREPAEEPVVETSEEPPVVTPEQAGLKLQSTVVGKTRQTAVINGRAYVPGNFVEVPDDPEVRFRVLQVSMDRVVLERNGDRFELRLYRDDATGSVVPWPDSQTEDGPPSPGT